MESQASNILSASHADSPASQDSPAPTKKRKRRSKQALAACSACRRAKKSCDSERPQCGRCRQMKLACDYDTENRFESRSQAVKRQYTDLQSVQGSVNDSLNWLKSQPSDVILSCIQRLGDNVTDPIDQLRLIVDAERAQRLPVPTLMLPNSEPLDSLLPAVQDVVDLQFAQSHPGAYFWLSEDGASLPNEDLRSASSSRLPNQTIQPRPNGNNNSNPGLHPHSFGRLTPKPPVALLPSRNEGALSSNLNIRDVNIRFWTTVPVSNQLAANLLSTYFSVEHPLYGFFDSHLFVRSLLKPDIGFCSPLLVNAILFWTSCTFAPQFPEASSLTASFLQSAQSLLEGEKSHDSLLQVASLMILTLGMICHGGDELAKEYMVSGIGMAERLRLIGEQRCDLNAFLGRTQEDISMIKSVAWGAFNLSTVYTLHFHDLYSGTFTKYPPLLPLPHSSAHMGTKSLTSNSQTAPAAPVAVQPVDSFPYFCKFWCIAHEIATVYYSSPGPIHEHVPFAFAEVKFATLLGWSDSLPPQLSRSENMMHNVAEIYICYHATVMDLFRPFLHQHDTTLQNPPIPTLLGLCRPEHIFLNSLHNLQNLIQTYDRSFSSRAESHTVAWIHGPLYVASAIVRLPAYENQKVDFTNCMRTTASLLQSHRVVELFLKALFGMAIHFEILTKGKAKAQLAALKERRYVVNGHCGYVGDGGSNGNGAIGSAGPGSATPAPLTLRQQQQQQQHQHQYQQQQYQQYQQHQQYQPEHPLSRPPPAVATSVVVDQGMALKDREKAVGDVLSQQFDDLTLFDEFLEV